MRDTQQIYFMQANSAHDMRVTLTHSLTHVDLSLLNVFFRGKRPLSDCFWMINQLVQRLTITYGLWTTMYETFRRLSITCQQYRFVLHCPSTNSLSFIVYIVLQQKCYHILYNQMKQFNNFQNWSTSFRWVFAKNVQTIHSRQWLDNFIVWKNPIEKVLQQKVKKRVNKKRCKLRLVQRP